MTLTKQDTLALRNADMLCFDHNADGTGAIRCIQRAENSSTGYEQVHVVWALMSSVENFDTRSHTGPWTAYESIQSAKHNDVARTIIRHLRVGLDFSLWWTRGNGSPLLEEAGLCRDDLRIRIGKAVDTDRLTKVCDTFYLRSFVGKDNSARMIKPAWFGHA